MQLLKITRVPIKYQLNVQRPRLELKQELPKADIQRTPGELKIQSKNISVRLDTFEARRSLGLKSVATAIEDSAQEGMQAVKQATAEYAEIGNQMAQIHKGANIPDIMYSKLFEQPTTQMVFLPSVGPQISWDANQMDLQYTPTKLNFDWNTTAGKPQYVPGGITMEIEQYPRLDIEYLGEPRYVPPSANPNYQETKQ